MSPESRRPLEPQGVFALAEHFARVGVRTRDGEPLPPVLHPIARARAQRQAVIGAELLVEVDERRMLTCLINAVPLPAPAGGGPSPGVLAVFYDITEASRLEGQVAAQAARLEAIADLVDEGIAVLDAGNRLVFINDAGRRLLGFPEGRHRPARHRWPGGGPAPARQRGAGGDAAHRAHGLRPASTRTSPSRSTWTSSWRCSPTATSR